MQNAKTESLSFVVGPLGERLTLENLPPVNTARWVPRRKAQIVSAINGGLISFEEASERCRLSLEESTEWMRWESRFGLKGLRVMKQQHYKAITRLETAKWAYSHQAV
jgi:hypothetical protein